MITVCATRSVLYAGMLHTVMPLSFAALRSILLYPVPASTMSFTVSGNCESKPAPTGNSFVTTTRAP